MAQLLELIYSEGGFRFRHDTTRKENLTYRYVCCQDSSFRKVKSTSKGNRDVRQMDRFACDSVLRMRPSLDNRTLTLTMKHTYHNPYGDIRLSPVVLSFINARVADQTPSQIFRELAASDVAGSESTTQHQVYYRWLQANAYLWRRDPDQRRSAMLLLKDVSNPSRIQHSEILSGNVRGIALYVLEVMEALKSCAEELAMDATSGTNNVGMDLFAVLTEYDGTGIPVAYCFIETMIAQDGVRRVDPGALSRLLSQFLMPIRNAGFNPSFFGTDKDHSEITAVKQVWPDTTPQLCYWHAKRPIRSKLKSATKTMTQAHYWPAEAQELIPNLEMCWGSLPTHRPDGDHRYGRCQCPTRAVQFDEKGRMEPGTPAERETVLQMFCRHFNAHPLIPDRNGIFYTPESIHRNSAREMYEWCKAKNYFRLWAYLFVNWYRSEQWELWARASNARYIPVLKTTMIVESHWRKLKHDFLHRFNRPRIDLVVWVLISRVIPDAIVRMKALKTGNRRRATAAWRKAFKREWKVLLGKEGGPESIQKYHTDPQRWTCACEAYIASRFLMCKHILHCYEPITDPIRFFGHVRRQRSCPFWVSDQLVLRPEYTTGSEIYNGLREEASKDMENTIDSELESDINSAIIEEGSLVDTDEDTYSELQASMSKVKFAVEIAQEQLEKGNSEFLKKFLDKNVSNILLAEELTIVRAQRTMPRTWTPNKHPATMYYK